MMDKETAQSLLEKKGFRIIEEKRLSNDTGWQLKFRYPDIDLLEWL